MLSVGGGLLKLSGCGRRRVRVWFHAIDRQRGWYDWDAGHGGHGARGWSTSHQAPLHDAGVLPTRRHQVTVIVCEANVGHVTAVGAVLVTRGLEEFKEESITACHTRIAQQLQTQLSQSMILKYGIYIVKVNWSTTAIMF